MINAVDKQGYFMKTTDTTPKLIKDLGYIFATTSSKHKARYGLFLCPTCEQSFKSHCKADMMCKSHQCRACFIKQNTFHGNKHSRLYSIWEGIKNRCLNKRGVAYKNYGAADRGLAQEWNSYISFRYWSLSNGYQAHLTIDRINNNKGYSSSNCRWVSKTIQSRNTKKIMVTNTSGYRGVSPVFNSKRWTANIGINNKQIRLGTSCNKRIAAHLYDRFILIFNLEHTKNFNYNTTQG